MVEWTVWYSDGMIKKSVVVHVKRGRVKQTEYMEIDELKSMRRLVAATNQYALPV